MNRVLFRYNKGMNSEYCNKMPACIHKDIAPNCPALAVIPSLTVESVSNLKGLANCFVHVSENNTTYYIDDKHRIIIAWKGDVEYDNYDYTTNPLNLKSQTVIDFANKREIHYNKYGNYLINNLTGE